MHLLVGTFVATKFISIFAFLFGLGAALQFRSIRRGHLDLTRDDQIPVARAVYRRRLRFLLLVGLAHGFLLYYGDILAFYAACGFILVLYLPARPARLVRAAVWWWIGALAAVALAALLAESVMRRGDVDGDPTLIPLETLRAFSVYTESGYLDQLLTRASDYTGVLLSMLVVSVPQIVGLFLLGLLAGRLGWLAHPARHAQVWQAATWIGLAALPFAAYGEWLNFEAMRNHPGDPSAVAYLLQFCGSALACFYVASMVRLRDRPRVAAFIHWIAPAGRMPLTNYLLQSLVMGILLSGWGLGLGAELNRGELALLALAIVGAQWPASRWWITRFGAGPMERWWANATYRGARSASTAAPPPP